MFNILASIGVQTLIILAITIYFIMVATAIITIVINKGDPVKAMSWIIVIIMLPVIGFAIYLTFGKNFRKQKLFTQKNISDSKQIDTIIARQLYTVNSTLIENSNEIVVNRDIITLLLNTNKSPITYNNTIDVLENGTQTFDSIFNALENAKSSIHLEYYIISDDKLGNQIADVLISKALLGVEVRVIYDAVGSWGLSKKYLNRLKCAGVQVEPFMPVAFPLLTSKINYRNHRKILVIDGLVGFTGGLNIADKYINGTPSLGAWRDTHLRIEGKAVHTLQAVFITDWNFVRKENLKEERYFAKSTSKPNIPIQIASSGPDTDWATIMQSYFAAITKAKQHIYISSPYFLPNAAILTALKVAALSGVKVRIMIPAHSDSKTVFWATRSYVGELLDAGVMIHLYYGGFNHSKILCIDSVWCSVGSANMDIRSFEDNFEISAIIYDNKTTQKLEKSFLEDLSKSTEVRPSAWAVRPIRHRLWEGFARLLSPLL